VRAPARHLAERRLANHLDPVDRQAVEHLRQLGARVGDQAVGVGQDLGAVLVGVGRRRVDAGQLRVVGLGVLEPRGARQRVLLGLNPLHFREAQLVHLFRGDVGGGLQLQRGLIPGRPVRQGQRADLAGRRLADVALRPRDQPLVARLHAADQRGARALQQGLRLARRHFPRRLQPGDLGLGVGPQRRVRAGGLERLAADQLAALGDHALVLEARHADAVGGRGPDPLAHLVHRRPDGLQAGVVGGHVRRAVDQVRTDQEAGQARVQGVAAQREVVAAELPGQLGAVQLIGPHVEADLAFERQRLAFEPRLHPRHAAAPPLQS
jgi:hypothetical protein